MRTRIVVLVCLVWLIAVPASRAQDAATARVAEEIAGVHASLDRLVELLETLLENQQVDLLLKRIDLLERRLEPTARRVRGAENGLESFESETNNLKAMLAQQKEQVEAEIRNGADPTQADSQRLVEELEAMIEFHETRVAEKTTSLRELEDELARRREAIEILDDLLLEKLE